mgnify:FL=1
MKSVASAITGINFRDANNLYRVTLIAPTSIGTSFSFVLPKGCGSAVDFMKTDGGGNLSFVTVSSTASDVIYLTITIED